MSTKSTPQESPISPEEDFRKGYAKLCEDTGYKIVARPACVPTNHGSFELVIEYRVLPINS